MFASSTTLCNAEARKAKAALSKGLEVERGQGQYKGRGSVGSGQSEGRAYVGGHEGAAKDSIEAGTVHLASLQRVSLILRESCYNVVT
jgi:hypothetical protein